MIWNLTQWAVSVLINAVLWMLAYLGSVAVTALVGVGMGEVLGGYYAALHGTPLDLSQMHETGYGEMVLNLAMILAIWVGILAAPFAVLLSGLPECFGRKPSVLTYGAAGALTALLWLIIIRTDVLLHEGWRFVSPHVAAMMVAGLCGGVTLALLRLTVLRARHVPHH